VLCALFLCGILLQACTGVLMHHHGAGWTTTSIAAYYRGSETPAAPNQHAFGVHNDDATAPPSSMPPNAKPIAVARTFGSLLEIAHLHAFAMPVVLFIVAHLFSMTPVGRQRWAGIICYGSFIAALTDIITPFLLRYVSADFALVKLAAFLALEGSLIFMVVITLWYGLKTFFTPPDNSAARTA
jgi:hypothetical protein